MCRLKKGLDRLPRFVIVKKPLRREYKLVQMGVSGDAGDANDAKILSFIPSMFTLLLLLFSSVERGIKVRIFASFASPLRVYLIKHL